MAKVDIWMPIYIGDYIADTMRLSTEQHGAYLLMLMEQWMSGPLPDDDDELAAITRMPIDKWLSIREKMARFYVVDGGTWTQLRLESEKMAAEKRRDAASNNGKKGGRPRKSETQKKPIGKPVGKPIGEPAGEPSSKAKRNPRKSSSPSPSPTQPKDIPTKTELPTEVDPVTGEILSWGAA